MAKKIVEGIVENELYYDADLIVDYILEKFLGSDISDKIRNKYIYNMDIFLYPTFAELDKNISFSKTAFDKTKYNKKCEDLNHNNKYISINLLFFDKSNFKDSIDEYFTKKNIYNYKGTYQELFKDFLGTKGKENHILKFLYDNKTYVEKLKKEKCDYFYEIIEGNKGINDSIKENFFEENKKLKDKMLIPGFYNHLQFNKGADILFVGMNPAGYDKEHYKKDEDEYKGFEYINNDDTKYKEQIKEVIKRIENFYEYSTYYGPFEKMFGHFDYGKWNHIDLFQCRGTYSNGIKKEIKESQKGSEDSTDNKFWENQYNTFMKLIDILEPKIIVVANAYASNYIQEKWYKGNDKNIEIHKDGYWKLPEDNPLNNNNTKGILFIQQFSSGRTDNGTIQIIKLLVDNFLKKLQLK